MADDAKAPNVAHRGQKRASDELDVPGPSLSLAPPVSAGLPKIDLNWCPFALSTPNHNLLLTLRSAHSRQPHPWVKCHRAACGKWRLLPPTLSALSPLLPAEALTLQSLNRLPAPALPFPFHCSSNTWDIDRRICSAIQDYQDMSFEWASVPPRFVRAPVRFDFYIALAHFLRVKGIEVKEYPCIYGRPVDLFALYTCVYQLGGDSHLTEHGMWPIVYKQLKMIDTHSQPADVDYLVEIYRSYFFEWQASMIKFASVDVLNNSGAHLTQQQHCMSSNKRARSSDEGKDSNVSLH